MLSCTSPDTAIDQSSPTAIPATATATQRLAPSSTPTIPPTLTRTPVPTYTPRPTYTPSQTPLPAVIPFSTFVPENAITQTPSPPEICPPRDEAVPALDTESYETEEDLIAALIGYFDAGGDPLSLKAELVDLTNDSVPEIILTVQTPGHEGPTGIVMVFRCSDGLYVHLHSEKTSYQYYPNIVAILDMNLNGIPELVISQVLCGYCIGGWVYEWDGALFQPKVRSLIFRDTELVIDHALMDGYAGVFVEDVDQNGTIELILRGGGPGYSGGVSGWDGPYRGRDEVYAWDGLFFTLWNTSYDPPRFRFEAVQDGDLAFIQDEYEEALAFYQDVIFSDLLASWSWDNWYELLNAMEGCCTPPDPADMPYNLEEYRQLSAYARYRIMLLHFVQGLDSDARIVFDGLVDRHPPGEAGYVYAQLATVFLEEYDVSHDLALACGKAVQFAEENPNLLTPLGNDHGFFVRYYGPDDICPIE